MRPEIFWISQGLEKGGFLVDENTGITPKQSGMASVQRHPTMPMTKRDSLVMTGSRLSLISTGSSANPTKHEEPVNTHPEMVAGKRRSPKKVKRTDSYKRALNRQSITDNLEETVTDLPSKRREDKKEDRQKYNTLPMNTAKPTITVNGDTKHRKKRPSGGMEGGEIVRNVSTRSGTCPSPDTDEDQRSIQPERKKKSAFKRFKERFISSVRRDSRKKDKRRPERDSPGSTKRTGRVRPNNTQSAAGFHTPSESSSKDYGLRNGHQFDAVDGHEQTSRTDIHLQPDEHSFSNGKSNGGSGILTIIRRSFRRKSPSPDLRHKKYSLDSRPTSSDLQLSPKVAPPSQRSYSQTHQPPTAIVIPRRSNKPAVIEDDIYNADDTITEIFGSLIDNRRPSCASPVSCQPPAPLDRSKLKLEGLQKCRPKSIDRGDRYLYGYQSSRLSPTVETDGFDFADGLPEQVSRPSQAREEEAQRLFYEVSQEEKQRRIDDVARCLAALGDRIAAEKELDSAGSSSELEGHMVGRTSLSSLERNLIRDLRHYADNEFQFGQHGISIATNLMPSVKNIIACQDYSNFKTVIQQELSNTNGWEQVAWYTYLIKTAVCISETGVGAEVKNRAKKYFNAVLRPWIQSRPNGWESIHEETDIDTELD